MSPEIKILASMLEESERYSGRFHAIIDKILDFL